MSRAKPTPIYYRFVYSPTTGDVTLSHNHECHPKDVPTHGEMAAQRPEHDLVCGFAYKIDGGWRLTDDEHRPLDDPHAKKAVVDSLSPYRVSQVEVPDFPIDEFSRMRYGMPHGSRD